MANQQAWATGTNIAADNLARQREIADEKRKGQLKTLLEDATTPQDKMAAFDAVYHQDPSVLKQHVENLTRRITGKPTQPVVSPAAAQQGRIAPLAARGQTPEQQKQQADISTFRQQGDIQNEQAAAKARQQQADTFALIDKYITDPEQNKAAKEGYVRKQAGIVPKITNIPGAGYVEYPPGSGQYARPVRNEDGTEAWEPAPTGYKPPPKTLPINREYANLLAKENLAKSGQGPALTPEERAQKDADFHGLVDAGVARMNALVQGQAGVNVVSVTDPDTGQDIVLTRKQISDAAKSGKPYLAGVVGAPTGGDKAKQILAQSAINQIDTMMGILTQDPTMTGPGSGQFTQFETWLGSNSADAQQFLAAATFLSEHGVGVFGGRNIHSIKDLQGVLGGFKTNPEALRAGLQQAKQTMQQWINPSGRLPGPRGPAPKAGESPSGGPKKKWSKGKWAKANPGKDVNAAEQQAQSQNMEVVP
jgi:hypothetical protein